MYRDKLARAFERRTALRAQFDAVRLVDGSGDGLPNIYIDAFGSRALIHAPSAEYLVNERELFTSIGLSDIFFRSRGKNAADNARADAEHLIGDDGESFVIQEHGIKYQINPLKQINAGLFIDMRDMRKHLINSAQGKRVLNLFCYTGSLGLAALAGGAVHVTQVDISKGILSWARENLELNQNYAGEMRFIPEDSLVFLEKEERRVARGNDAYDIVIVDPPSFSRSERGTFQIERDFPHLIKAIDLVVKDRCEILFTTNLTTLSAESMIDSARSAGLKGAYKILLPPVDFSSSPEQSIAMRGFKVSR